MTDKLAIVGNGFDLAHGLKTNYFDFFKNLSESEQSGWLEILGDYKIAEPYWYSFEEVISQVTLEWYLDSDQGYFFAANDSDKTKFLEKKLIIYMRSMMNLKKTTLLDKEPKIERKNYGDNLPNFSSGSFYPFLHYFVFKLKNNIFKLSMTNSLL